MRHPVSPYLLALLILAAPGASAQDTLTMTNGDILRGQIAQMRDGSLTIATPYAPALAVDWAGVAAVETAAPVYVQAGGAAPVQGTLALKDGTQGIATEAGWQALELAAVTVVTRETPAEEGTPAALETVEEESPWSGTATAGMTLRSGNTDTLDVAVDLEAVREREQNTLTLGASGAYGQDEDTINTRRHALRAKWQYYPSERLYLFGQGLEEQDDGRKLDLRLRATVGLGYDIIERDRLKLSGDIGLSHTWEDWAAYTPAERDAARNSVRAAGTARLRSLALGLADGSVPATISTARDVLTAVLDIRDPLRYGEERTEDFMNLQLGLYYEQQLFEHSTVTGELLAHPSLEDLGEVQLTSKVAFVTPLRERLDLRIALESAYDSTADQSDVDAWDHTLITGLRYAF